MTKKFVRLGTCRAPTRSSRGIPSLIGDGVKPGTFPGYPSHPWPHPSYIYIKENVKMTVISLSLYLSLSLSLSLSISLSQTLVSLVSCSLSQSRTLSLSLNSRGKWGPHEDPSPRWGRGLEEILPSGARTGTPDPPSPNPIAIPSQNKWRLRLVTI